ncbi:hypothetical protein AAC387_Pa06g0495 [Persea americana]
MHPSPNFGLDWATPFQLGPSLFLLLSCTLPSSSITFKGTPICDPSNAHLCAYLYTCPALSSLSLPLFAPSNSCCVYSPANLGPHMDLDIQGLKCAGFSSVVSLGDSPADPSRWEYGVVLKFGERELDGHDFATACDTCEKSDGVCGYAPPRNYFVCVCQNGVNTTLDCYGQTVVGFQKGAAPTSLVLLFFNANPSLIAKVQSSHWAPWRWRGGLIAMVANFDSSQASGSISNRIGIDHDEYCLLGTSILLLDCTDDEPCSGR